MSKKGLESIVKKAVTDRDFRSKLFQDPESVVADQDVSTDEIEVLKSIKLDKEGDISDASALDSIDPEMAKIMVNDPLNGCFTLFVRCY